MWAGLKEIYISYALWFNQSSAFFLDLCHLRQTIIHWVRKPNSVDEIQKTYLKFPTLNKVYERWKPGSFISRWIFISKCIKMYSLHPRHLIKEHTLGIVRHYPIVIFKCLKHLIDIFFSMIIKASNFLFFF